ncbi:MAG: NAD(P)/FAD-dependent oxidoreductase [Actinobacteria bacterium]|nr:NAD(P)/FAD-dependent oxidoreductase [Actinomycetota bacterium]
MKTVDVVVVGMGPGGEAVAGKLAQAGLEVVGIEAELVGGECPYWGCVPSKMMIRAANLLAEGRRIPGMAGTSSVDPDFAPVAERIRAEATDNWDDQVAVDRFVGQGGTFVRGKGRLVDSDVVEVDGDQYRATRAIVFATGTKAAVPPIDGLAGTPFWTNREAVSTTEVPASLIVVGGGAIGSELAQVFSRFGADVTVVEGADRLLPYEEPAAGELIAEVFESEGMVVRTGASVDSVAYSDEGRGEFTITVDGKTMTAEKLLIATGRRTDVASLGLDNVGVAADARFIPVDDRLHVADKVWAVGDITGKGAFTHVAVYQAKIAAAAILGQGLDAESDDEPPAADYSALSRVTFTDPEVGSVGMTEAQARDAGLDIRIGRANVPSTARGWIHKVGNEGFIEVIEDTASGTLVGATSVGPVGGEVLGALAVAVHAKVPVATLKSMIYAYPTFHRGIEDAVNDLSA